LQAEAKASERAEDLAFLASWDVRVKELKEEEEAERRDRLEAARKLQVGWGCTIRGQAHDARGLL
jgi:hypothetical protein